MALSPVTNTTGIADTAASSTDAKAQKAALDKDAFLKLLVAQLSHQDPLAPTEGTEFVAQLSQFAMVEQAIAQSAKLDVLSSQMTGLASNEATSLVGKEVSVRGSGIAFDGVTATGASVTLDGPAAKVTVRIQDASGQTVRTLELGAQNAGAISIAWDGKDDAGQPVAKGSYSVKVDAQTKEGTPVGASQGSGGRVVKVTFDKGYPELHLDSGVTAPISDLVSVGGEIR
jgi:flagellar basal-body rod modification protein FlgD